MAMMQRMSLLSAIVCQRTAPNASLLCRIMDACHADNARKHAVSVDCLTQCLRDADIRASSASRLMQIMESLAGMYSVAAWSDVIVTLASKQARVMLLKPAGERISNVCADCSEGAW